MPAGIAEQAVAKRSGEFALIFGFTLRLEACKVIARVPSKTTAVINVSRNLFEDLFFIPEVHYVVRVANKSSVCGRTWDRTMDLVLIRNALYHWAMRPKSFDILPFPREMAKLCLSCMCLPETYSSLLIFALCYFVNYSFTPRAKIGRRVRPVKQALTLLLIQYIILPSLWVGTKHLMRITLISKTKSANLRG